MKKRYLYSITLLLFALAAGFIVVKYKKDELNKAAVFYELKERTGMSAQTGEWKQEQKQFADLMKVVRTNPDDIKSRIALASLYIREARITGNYMYYDMAAMKYVNEVLEKDSLHFDALALKSLLYLSQHHFADGLVFAEKARSVNPYNAFVYGILVDGHVETGDYTAAVADADKMVSIRPDIRSYSRISYLREIHGDYPGAIDAMKRAVKAGPSGDEATEWTRVQLGHLYENVGDLKNAEMNYLVALENRPAYAYAIAGKARIALASKDYNKAIAFYVQADSLVNDYSFKEELVDIYQLTGQKNKADSLSAIVINAMRKDAQSGRDNASIGHYADRELAYAYLKTGEYGKALEHALAEYNRRPANIDVNETVAWVYYNKSDFAKAIPYVEVALKTDSRNPTLLCHAGLIYAKAGDKEKAKTILQEAFKNDPNMAEKLKTEAIDTLKTL
jgi:tetratricopeptide (TPR) repeat protein